MKVNVIIPNYNGKKLLEKNLPVLAKEVPQSQIIIVDDASTDDSVSFLQTHYPNIKLIQKTKNSGFASTVNLGVKAATSEIVILLNTDVKVTKHFLTFLVPHFMNPDVFSVGCLEKSIEKKETVERGRSIGYFKNGFLLHKKGEPIDTTTLWTNGGSSAFNKSIWEKLGGMDELYDPFYWEDIDISYRAIKSGYQVIFEKKSIVEHHHEEGSIKTQYSKSQIKTIAYRNQLIFVWKNITDSLLLIQHLLWLPRYLLSSIFAGDTAFIKGFISAFFLFPKIIHRRMIQKEFFTKTDSYVLSTVPNN